MLSKPKVAIISSNRGRWSSKDRSRDRETQNGVEAWVHALDGDYIGYDVVHHHDLYNYDLIIANTTHIGLNHLPKLVSLGLSRPSTVKWVSLIEGSATDYLKPFPFIKEALDLADLVNVINRHTLSFFQAMTTSRCEYIGIPYPFDSIRKFAIPIEKRGKKVLLCPMLSKRWSDYFVAKAIGLPIYGYEKRISRKLHSLRETFALHQSFDPNKYLNIVRNRYKDPNLEILQDVGQEAFLKQNANAFFWINLDERYTWGRYVLDAAALQVPIITTRSTGHADYFFPDTTVENEYQIAHAISIGKQLSTDMEFYRHVALNTGVNTDFLSHQTMREKLFSLLEIS